MSYLWAAVSHVGRMRAGNEDALFPPEGGAGDGPFVAVVADGMGGHVGGEIASRLAVDAAVSCEGDSVARVRAANTAIVEAVVADPALGGMGTTITIGIFEPDGTVDLGHVGDSRAYVLRGGELRQVTTDHSLVAELLAAGRIRPEDVRTHPQRNLVTRALGMAQDIRVDSVTLALESGDRMLLCSDGLTGMVGDGQIAETLGAGTPAEEAAWALVDAANAAGGVDNITVVIVDRLT